MNINENATEVTEVSTKITFIRCPHCDELYKNHTSYGANQNVYMIECGDYSEYVFTIFCDECEPTDLFKDYSHCEPNVVSAGGWYTFSASHYVGEVPPFAEPIRM